MKSESQVTNFLKHVKGENEIDELAIIQFCAQRIDVKVKLSSSTDSSVLSITYAQFKEWFERPAPEIGSIIVFDNPPKIIAIVRSIALDSIIAGVTIVSGECELKQDVILPNSGYRDSDSSENIEITHVLAKNGFVWSHQYNKLVERFSPTSGNYVRLTFTNGSIGIGVFREKRDGRIIMFCVKVGTDPVRYNLFEDIGLAEDIDFSLMNNAEKKILSDDLEKVGKVWNGYMKRIESLNLRVSKGEKYYCITEKLSVVAVHESLSFSDKKRYWVGNYFRTEGDATEVLASISEIIKIQLAKPER